MFAEQFEGFVAWHVLEAHRAAPFRRASPNVQRGRLPASEFLRILPNDAVFLGPFHDVERVEEGDGAQGVDDLLLLQLELFDSLFLSGFDMLRNNNI